MGDSELALRAHIRSLLLDYSRKHLTIDYVTFTRRSVSEILSECLAYIPTHDPTSLLLPTEPFDILAKRWHLSDLEEYEEHAVVRSDALQHVKNHLPPPGKPKSTTIWYEDQDAVYNRWLLSRPLSPVLTIRALRETPKLGSKSVVDMTPKSHKELFDWYRVHPVEVEDIEEQLQPDLDDALDNKPSMDAETYAAITESIKLAARQLDARQTTQVESTYTLEFLRADSPVPMPVRLESPPLFARDRLPGHKPSNPVASCHPAGLKSMSDLAAFIPPLEVKKEDEEDLYKEHLVVVNGWHAYNVPSSPLRTPSLGDSSSEVDELLPPSPEDTQLFIQKLASAKMDEYELPKSERIGGARTKPKAIGDGQSLGSFLGTLLKTQQPHQEHARIVTTPKSQPSSPHTAITMSMLGQPPSALEDVEDFVMDLQPGRTISDDFKGDMYGSDLEDMVGRICGTGPDDEDLRDVIMNEKIDERYCLLMDVPELPPPNEHPTSMFIPRKLSDLVVPPNPASVCLQNSVQGTLKKVKGLRSLTMELTWKPFKYGSSIPTDDDGAGVADSNTIRDAVLKDLDDIDEAQATSELQKRLDEALALDTDLAETGFTPSMRQWWAAESVTHDCPLGFGATSNDIVLTRTDRQKALGLPVDAFLALSQDEDVTDEEMHRCTKRVKFEDHSGAAEELRAEDLHQVDDSGILMVEPGHNNESVFGQLALRAEGFDGPLADGDLFLDIDPLHEVDFATTSQHVHRLPYPVPAYVHIQYNVPTTHEVAASPELSQDPQYHESGSWPAEETQDSATFMPLPFDSGHPIASYVLKPDASYPHQHDYAPEIDIDLAQPNVNSLPNAATYPSLPFASLNAPACHAVQCDMDSLSDGHKSPSLSSGTLLHVPARPSVPTSQFPSSTSARQSLEHFLKFRGKSTASGLALHVPPRSSNPALAMQDLSGAHGIPEDVLDAQTLHLREYRTLPTTMHRYMASLEFIQKRALVVSLASPRCLVDLIERESLGDVQIIVDPDSAILFITLASLPSLVDSLLTRLSQVSWRYQHLLVIFEAYPLSTSYRTNDESSASAPYAFSPPVIKAVKKLRRDLGIADACQSKDPSSTIKFAFASTAEEAARYTRIFGDIAQERDATGGAIWGGREWLDLDEQDGEYELAGVDGMNIFAASIILCQMGLEDLLDVTPDERLEYFAGYVGTKRITRFNEEFALRLAAMEIASSSPQHSPDQQSADSPVSVQQ